MNKSITSALVVTLMAFSGLAAAQTVNIKSGTDGGAGPTGASGYGDNGASVTTREAVKAERTRPMPGIGGGSGASPATNPNTMNLGASGSAKTAPQMTASERKAQRAEARAARKARLTGQANNPPVKSGGSAL